MFLGLANIHAVRSSYHRVHEVLARGAARDADYLRSLDESGWLQHLASLLRGALGCAHTLHAQRRSVLVHCSDGWDRTAQAHDPNPNRRPNRRPNPSPNPNPNPSPNPSPNPRLWADATALLRIGEPRQTPTLTLTLTLTQTLTPTLTPTLTLTLTLTPTRSPRPCR